MAYSPTIVAASLSDEELKKSVKSLVDYVDTQLNIMVASTNIAVNSMEKKLKSLGSIKIDSGGAADGGSSRRTSSVERETKARKELITTLDQQAEALSKAAGRKKGIEYITLQSDTDPNLTYLINASKDVDAQMDAILKKEQALIEEKQREAQITEQIAAAQRAANAVVGVSSKDLGIEPNISAGRARQKAATASVATETEYLRQQVASLLEVEEREIKVTNTTSSSYLQLAQYLKHLQSAYQRLGADRIAKGEGTDIAKEIQMVQRAMQSLQKTMNRPVSLKDALSLPTKTLDDIEYKIRQLQAYKGGIDFTRTGAASEIRQVDNEIRQLKKDMDKYMMSANNIANANNALTRSWNYMKNRLAFYFTVGASTQFIKNLIEVRSQYEMNERALGILINSAERGTQIFNELSQMALVSPYTLIELSSAAKQLTAYDVAARDVVDTTRRLADMAAAVGIPIERLTYALGQIKAYGYLNSRDNRMFANAGIPLVKQLSEYYTELEGRLVSTADVYDRIKKKAVDYNDVMQVINKMTDEGGKFFDFQAKMAETMKVQLANLTLAWNNMLNDIGEANQGILVGGIGALKEVFLHWKDLEHVVNEIVFAFGMYKAAQLIVTKTMGTTASAVKSQILAEKAHNATILQKQALVRTLTADEKALIISQKTLTASEYQQALSSKNLTKQKALLLVALNKNNVALKAALVNMGLLTAAEANNITLGKALGIVLKSVGISLAYVARSIGAFFATNWWMFALAGLYELWHAYDEAQEHIKELNTEAAEHAKQTFENLKEYLESASVVDIEQKAINRVMKGSEAEKAWQQQKDKIDEVAIAANSFISILEKEPDINMRIAKSFDYLKDVERVAGVMKTMADDAIVVSTSTWGGVLGEGLVDDLKDYVSAYEKYQSLSKNLQQGTIGEKFWNDQKDALEELRGEIQKTTNSIYNFASREGFNINEQREFFERMISETAQKEQMGQKERRLYRIRAEEEYYNYAKKKLEEQLAYQDGKQAEVTRKRLSDIDAEFGQSKAMQESFFAWLSEKHSNEVQKRLKNKTKQEIEQGAWLTKENLVWIEKMTKDFSKEYGVSFEALHNLVKLANTWTINIPVFFRTIGQPVSDIAEDYESRTGKKFAENPVIKDATTQVDVIKKLQDAQDELATKMETARKAGGKYYEDNKKAWENENRALVNDIHAYGALTKAEEKALKEKGNGKGRDTILDALKKEIDLVKKLQSDYDKLTRAGATSADAFAQINSSYGKTIAILNRNMAGWGLPQLDLSMFEGKDPNKINEFFARVKDSLEKRGLSNLERVKVVEAVIQEFSVTAKVYNLDKITKGLNNELDKLKDEYELSIELDANPELGGAFADMFGIDTSKLTNSIDEYMQGVQDAFTKSVMDMGYGNNVNLDVFAATEDSWRLWAMNVGLSEEQLDEFSKKFKTAQDFARKWAEDVVKQTKSLQYSLADTNGKIAIKEKELADLRTRLNNETNEKQKELLRLQIQEQENAIAELRAGLLQEIPEYAALFNSIVERSDYMTRRLVANLKKIYDAAKARGADANGNYTITGADGTTTLIGKKQFEKEYEKLTREERKSQAPFKKIKEAFSKDSSTGLVDWAKGIELVSSEVQKLGSVASEVGNLAQIFGADEQTVEIINDVATSLNGVATAGQGISQIASGDYLGGAASLLSGITSIIGAWADNDNKRIDAEINESERAVKRLEIAYKDLEDAASKAYGAAVSGANRAALANKELQLAEIKRQIQLEKSRDSKDKDEDKILELESQYKELLLEIKNGVQDIVNEMLGISSVGDGITALVEAMVSAFRNGEDAMEAFSNKWDEMIDNMILKLIVSQYMQTAWDKVMDILKSKEEEFLSKSSADIASIQSELSQYEEMYERYKNQENSGGLGSVRLFEDGWIEERINALRKQLSEATSASEQASGDYLKWSLDYMMGEGRDYMTQVGTNLADALGEWYTFGQDKDKNLSALQQGIQGITEDTAGALEAMMNGISQQVYLQSEYLRQIVEFINIDADPMDDVKVASLSQILLQLQTNYTLMQTIDTRMENWSTATGNGIRVELLS